MAQPHIRKNTLINYPSNGKWTRIEDVIPIEKSGDMILVYFMAYEKL